MSATILGASAQDTEAATINNEAPQFITVDPEPQAQNPHTIIWGSETDNILNAPEIRVAMENSKAQAAFRKGAQLGNQNPDTNSRWEVIPFRADITKSVQCFAALTLDPANDATVTDKNGVKLSTEEVDALRMNTTYIIVTKDQAYHRAGFELSSYGYGYPAHADISNVADTDAFPTKAASKDAMMIPVSFMEITGGYVYATSSANNPHQFAYTIPEGYPEQALSDCNQKAAAGGFNAEFAERKDIIAEIIVPAAEAEQAALQARHETGGLCSAFASDTSLHGRLSFLAHFSPATTVDVSKNPRGQINGFGTGDLIEVNGGSYRHSRHLQDGPFGAQETSGCLNDTRPVCVDVDTETQANGDLKVSYSFCEASEPPAIGITPGGSAPPITKTVIRTRETPGFTPFDWEDDEPTRNRRPHVPETHRPPPAVPVPPAIALMVTGVAALGALGALRRRRNAAEEEQPTAEAQHLSGPSLD